MNENTDLKDAVGKTGTLRIKDRFLNLLGTVVNKQHVTDLKRSVDNQRSLFSESELTMLRSDNKTGHSYGGNKGSSVISHINKTTDTIAERIEEATELAQIFPEADQARSILVPSIMSPTDMNGGNIQVTYTGKLLPEASRGNLCELVSDFINEELDLPTKLPVWIGDAMFETGATPVMQLPRSLASDISTSPNIEGGTEAMRIERASALDMTPTFLTNKDTSIDIGTEALADARSCFGKSVSTEDTSTYLDKLTSGLSGLIDMSMDTSRISSATEANNNAMEVLNNRVAGALANPTTGNANNNSILFMYANSIANEGDEGLPVRLPTGSVIPISPPGAPEARLGYFVAIDSLGSPLNSQGSAPANTLSASAEFDQLLSGGTTGTSYQVKNQNSEQKSAVMQDLFELILDHTLMSSVKGATEGTYNIANNKELSMSIFCKVMAKEKVSFIFVPASQMAYYAFSYHPDGTGKSFIEGASLIIALRSACLISKVYSIINSAKDRRKVSYELPEGADNSQAEQINSVVRKLITEKYGINLTTNYRTFLSDMSSSGVSIMPRNLQGLKDFTVENEIVNDNLSQVDTELEDMLTRMAAMRLKVPAGALDNVHEQEFSRSIATSNILFSNDVRVLQQVVCRETSVLVRAATLNSSGMVEKIKKLIDDSGLGTGNETDDITDEDLLLGIVKDIKITLPSPKVSTDKVKLEEINDTARAIGDAVDALWPESFVLNEDNKVKEAFIAYRDSIKQEQIEQLLASSGDTHFNNIPNIKDINIDKLRKINQVAANIAAMATKLSSATTPEGEEGGGGGGGNW